MASKRKPRSRQIKASEFAHDGKPSVFTCPDCSGTLFLVKHGPVVQFRCRIGHLYSPENMLEAQNDNVERSLWTAVRALEEQAEYTSQMARQLASARDRKAQRRYLDLSHSALEASRNVRHVIDQTVRD